MSIGIAVKEDELIEQCQNGDLEAFEQLVSKYEDRIFNAVLRITGDYEGSKDVCQDVFIKVFQAIGKFKKKSSFYTWIYRIAVNQALEFCNKRKRKKVVSLDEPINNENYEVIIQVQSNERSPEECLESNELKEVISIALLQLSPEFRAVLILKDMQDFSYEEIAVIVHSPIGTVKSRISRARKELKGILKDRL